MSKCILFHIRPPANQVRDFPTAANSESMGMGIYLRAGSAVACTVSHVEVHALHRLILMLVVATSVITIQCKQPWKITEILVHGYLSESTQLELSNNEYQQGRV